MLARDLDGLVVHRDRVRLELQVGFELRFHVLPDAQLHRVHRRRGVEEQDAFDQHLGVLHLVDRLLLDEGAEPVIAPVVTHLGVQEVLVDGRELLAQSEVQLFDDLLVPAHSAASLCAASGDACHAIVCRIAQTAQTQSGRPNPRLC